MFLSFMFLSLLLLGAAGGTSPTQRRSYSGWASGELQVSPANAGSAERNVTAVQRAISRVLHFVFARSSSRLALMRRVTFSRLHFSADSFPQKADCRARIGGEEHSIGLTPRGKI